MIATKTSEGSRSAEIDTRVHHSHSFHARNESGANNMNPSITLFLILPYPLQTNLLVKLF